MPAKQETDDYKFMLEARDCGIAMGFDWLDRGIGGAKIIN